MCTNNKYRDSFVFSVVLFSINRACYLARWEKIILPSLLCLKVATRYFSACNNRLCTLSCIGELFVRRLLVPSKLAIERGCFPAR